RWSSLCLVRPPARRPLKPRTPASSAGKLFRFPFVSWLCLLFAQGSTRTPGHAIAIFAFCSRTGEGLAREPFAAEDRNWLLIKSLRDCFAVSSLRIFRLGGVPMKTFTTLLAWCLLFLAFLSLADTSRALDNGLALAPPMGWNSWNKFGC